MKPARVLFIEHDDMERRAFLRMVRNKTLPWDVQVAETLAAARAQLTKSRFDVIVADNHLPDGEPTELFAGIPDTPFVLITGTLEEQLALLALERGAGDYLVKDVKRRHLEAVPFAVEKTLYCKAIQEEQRQLTRELRESEQRLRATFDNAASGILQTDNRDCLVAVNDRLCRMLGYSREELLGKNVLDLTYVEDRPRTIELVTQLHEGRRPWFQCEKRLLKRDSFPLWVQVAVSAALDEAGRYRYLVATVVDISARKAAEAQLRLQAAALEAAPNSISVSKTDPEGTIVWVNAAFAKLTGYSVEEAIGRSHHILSSGEQDEAFYRNLWQTIKSGEVWRGELVNRRKDGTLYHEETGITPLCDEHGNITHFVAIKQDITARKKAEEKLRQSEESIRRRAKLDEAVMANLAEGLFTLDADGLVTYVNPAAEHFLGFSSSELIGRKMHDMIHYQYPDGTPFPIEECAGLQVLHRGTTLTNWEDVFIRKGGESFPVVLSSAPIQLNGGIVGLVVVFRDVTIQRQAEAAVHESQQRFATFMDHLPGAAWIKDIQGRYLYTNHEAQRIFSNFGELVGKTDEEIFPPQTAREFRKDDLKALEEGSVRTIEVQRQADGVAHHSVVHKFVVPGPDGADACVGGVAFDITERVRAEEALSAAKLSAERAKAAAEQANKAKDHFLAVLSHELRTPLTPVVTAVSMLHDDPHLNESVREMVEMIRRNVELEARLIDDLLDMTRIARGKVDLDKRPMMLCDVIRRTVEVCKPDIEARRLHFDMDLGPDAPYVVHGDVARLQQVFWNLLKNAVKFTPQGGYVGIRCRLDNHTVVTEVSDSGLGIERSDLALIFNAFEQAERSITRQFGGLGLGLAIAKAIVEMHDGTIEAESQGRNKGTTLRVRLPILASEHLEESGGGQRSVHVPSPSMPTLRILLVEDHGDTAAMMQAVLAMNGHEVHVAGDVATALEEADKYPFDLLLSDLGLPDANGLDLMRELRARGHMMPGIALSGYGQEEDIQRSKTAGFAAHLTKPTSPERLAEAIAAVTGHAPVIVI